MTISTAQLAKDRDALSSKLRELNIKRDRWRQDLETFDNKSVELEKRIEAMNDELERRARTPRNEEPRVTDHALMRFMERILNLDLDALRGRMLTPTVAAAIRAGASAVTVEGVRLVVCGGVITTVLDAAERRRTNHGALNTAAPPPAKAAVREGLDDYYGAAHE